MPIRRPRMLSTSTSLDTQDSKFSSLTQQEFDRLVQDVAKLRDGRLAGHISASTLPVMAGAKGDFVKYDSPTLNLDGSILLGWICTVSGDPATWEEVRACDCASSGGGLSSATKPDNGTGSTGDYVQNTNPSIVTNTDGTQTITIGWIKIGTTWEDVDSFVGYETGALATVYTLPLYSQGPASGAVLSNVYGTTYAWEFVPDDTTDVHTSFRVPSYQGSHYLQLAVTTPNIASGDVVWQFGILTQQEGSLYGNNSENVVTISTLPNSELGDYQMVFLEFDISGYVSSDHNVNLRIIRAGSATEDTLSESAWLMNLTLKSVKNV